MTWDLDATPRVAWVAVQVAPTGWLYQPLKSGPRESCAAIPVGASASILSTLVVTVIEPASFAAVHDFVKPAFGPGIVIAGWHPESTEVASVTVQCRTMLLPWVLPRYQPLFPLIPST